MMTSRQCRAALATLLLLSATARADGPPSPLRLMPAEADVLVQVPNPRKLAETVTGLELLRQLESFSAFKEAVDSTQFRRFRQFLAYYEKELGASWPQLLDELAGGGIALGVKIGKNPAPVLLVVQGRDAKRVQRFAELGLELLTQELARQDEKAKPVRAEYKGIQTVRVGDQFFAANVGAALLVANHEKALQMGIDLHLDQGGKCCADVPSIGESAKLLPANALATLWLNMETVRKDPNVAGIYKTPRDDPIQTTLFGGYLDLLGRSPFLAAGLLCEGQDFVVAVRMPKGRRGMGPDHLLHVPPAGSPGSRPLLEPKDVLFSTSFYFDAANFWRERDQLFPEKVAKAIEKNDKDTPKFLANLRISQLLPLAGPYLRFVAAAQPATAYRNASGQPIPAFALVSELRDPEKFRQTMEPALRGAAFFASTQVKLKLVEEKIGDVALVGYRFAEDQPLKVQANAFPFRFYSPCFACVGNQFLWCSTIELGRELVGILQKEPKDGEPAAVRTRFYATGAAAYLDTIQDQLITQVVLDRALTADVAAREVKSFLDLLRTGGAGLNVDARYDDERFTYNMRLKTSR